jgi:hypothetical protein
MGLYIYILSGIIIYYNRDYIYYLVILYIPCYYGIIYIYTIWFSGDYKNR